MADRWRASIVIPAHNEEAVIGRCLASLASARATQAVQVVVVANGCTDRTVEVARDYADRLPGLVVEDLAPAGKSGALNVGDAIAEAFPRVFLDADIELGPGVLDGLLEVLAVDEARVGAPRVRFDTAGASRAVRAYYRAFAQLPYASQGLVGLGVYGLSRTGRSRFPAFPAATSDDLYVQQLFSPEERITSPGEFVGRTPQTLAALIRVRTRIAYGNRELAALVNRPGGGAAPVAAGATTTATVVSLLALAMRRPVLLPAAAVYVWVTVLARVAARREGSARWHRDETSRT